MIGLSPVSCSTNLGSDFRTLRFWRNLFLYASSPGTIKKKSVSHPCGLQEVNLAWGFQPLGLLRLTAGRCSKDDKGREVWPANVTDAAVISLASVSVEGMACNTLQVWGERSLETCPEEIHTWKHPWVKEIWGVLLVSAVVTQLWELTFCVT